MNEKLGHFFQQSGMSVNVTKADSYKNQQAGYYTGGGIYARSPVYNTNLATISLPGFRAGCGGIDMFTGALSFVSSEQLIHSLRAIISNGGAYAYSLAMESMSPQIKNIMSELNELAESVNMANINSCEIAATTVGALWPQSDVANKQLCSMIGTDSKYMGFSDYAAARQGCGSGGKRKDVFDRAEKDEKYKKMMATDFNLAWSALKENAFLSGDKELSELFMSISGTIIVKKTGESTEVTYKPSLADKEGLISALLNGGEAEVYKCQATDQKCLTVLSKRVTFQSSDSFVTKVQEKLNGIIDKIYSETSLTKDEIGFLNSTRLPLHKFLNVMSAQKRGASMIDIQEFSELAAIDIVYQFLVEVLDIMSESASHLKNAQVDDSHLKEFQNDLNRARTRVSQRRNQSFKMIEQQINMVQKMELIEKSIHSKLSTLYGDM